MDERLRRAILALRRLRAHLDAPALGRRASSMVRQALDRVSDDGKDVYITFNGPGRSEGTPYTVYSHDAGATWSRPVGGVQTNGLYWFAGGLTVTPEGTAISSQDAYEQDYRGDVLLYVLRSEDGGRSWSRVPIAKSRQGRRCPRWAGCGLGFLGPQMATATDDGGRVYVLWNQTSRSGGPARVYLRWSDDEGETWSSARQVSSSNQDRVDSEFPMIVAAGRGDVRVAWMDNRTGRWNTWYRRSTDGGRTWSTLCDSRIARTAHPTSPREGSGSPTATTDNWLSMGVVAPTRPGVRALAIPAQGAPGTPAARSPPSRSPGAT